MLEKLFRAFRQPPKAGALSAGRTGAEVALQLVGDADRARDQRNYASAALLYEQALQAQPGVAAIHIQCGHMFKEAGKLAEAEGHYLQAMDLSPGDADLALQLGHFYKVAGRPQESEAAYRRAVELSPGWSAPLRELADIRRAAEPPVAHSAWFQSEPGSSERLAPELEPTTGEVPGRSLVDPVQVRRLGGRPERSPWGLMKTLRGVEAIRGYCISSSPISDLNIFIDELLVDCATLEESLLQNDPSGRRKYVYNAWVDFSSCPPGLRKITLRFVGEAGEVRSHAEFIVIASPRIEANFPDSDSVVQLSAADPRSAEAQIRERPSMVRSARRALLPHEPQNVLVLRTDQLGDLVTSIPALRRLRELLPNARLVGLLTAANADLARVSQLFDEIIVIEFPDDEVQRRRIMSREAQAALRERLSAYRFDIAMDLAESAVSRPLLLLSGAKFLYGFHDREWPWLNAGFDGATHDAANGLEVAAQSTKVMGLVERLGASLASRAQVIRRRDLTREALAPFFGVTADERFVVLHTGARIAFSRWPYYEGLAARLLRDTDVKVILITDDLTTRARLPAEISSSDRFRLVDERLPFDEFDALLSYCAAFVGNDSGPKHLAALRGSPVVSIHSARINWSEWGQELTGSIISRRVPCAGCAIFHDSDECGKQFACIVDISIDEVFSVVARALERPRA